MTSRLSLFRWLSWKYISKWRIYYPTMDLMSYEIQLDCLGGNDNKDIKFKKKMNVKSSSSSGKKSIARVG